MLRERPNNKLKIELIYKDKEEEVLNNIRPVSLEEVKRFGSHLLPDEWFNMLIFGDNLPVMKALMEGSDIKGQVRLIYIDPPFSTRQVFRAGESRTSTISPSDEDLPAYQDLLVGPEYLEFLRKRLVLLRELLADDGSIYVHIDWKMGHYVKVLMDEIFGQDHFINDIARIKCNPKNFERKGFGNIKDMILFYSKTDNFVWNGSYVSYTKEQLERLFPKVDKDGRRYTTTPLHAPGETKNGPTGQPWRGMLPPRGRHWRYPPDVLEQLDRQGLIEWSSTGNPRKKIYADEFVKKKMYRQDIWEFKDPQYPSYPTEKNLEMLKVIVEASSNRGDIVLDCFSGSGTTLIAAEQLGRRWIGIDNSPKAIEVTLKRLKTLGTVSPFILYKSSEASLPETIQEVLQQ
jgi:adenine-specific DNA-methyltransferase